MFIAVACTAPPPVARTERPISTSAPSGAPSGLTGGRVLSSKAGLDLWSSLPDGSGRVAVTQDGSAGGYVSGRWSPDASQIAAERSMPGEGGTALYLLRQGRAPERLTRADTFLDGYVWSPDGRYVAYGEVISGATAAAGGLTLGRAVRHAHLYDTQTSADQT